jgi:hypothetical protein
MINAIANGTQIRKGSLFPIILRGLGFFFLRLTPQYIHFNPTP